MPKTYQCVRPWARNGIGEIITEHEYNKLPFEIKRHGNFVEVVKESPIEQVVNAPVVKLPDPEQPKEEDLINDLPITVDALKSIDRKHRYKSNL